MNSPHRHVFMLTATALLVLISAVSCQEVKEPTTTLTQAQWSEVQANILTAAPAATQFPVGAVYGERIEFIGFDVEPKSPKAGQEVTITWYWKALKEMKVNWQVFVHFDGSGARQGLDHHPVRDLYQTTRWKAGQVVKDVQKVRLRNDFPGGNATFWVGFWNPATGRRLPLSNPSKVPNDKDNRVKAGTVKVQGNAKAKGKSPRRKHPKIYLVRPLDTSKGSITIDGKIDEDVWKGASRSPRFGGTRGGAGAKGDTWFKMLYDESHLYIALRGDDKDVWGTLTERDSETWTQEVMEIFIDPEGDQKDYLELQITPKNTIFDAKFAAKLGRGKGSREEQINTAKAWNSTMETAVHVEGTLNDPSDEDTAWSVEIKLPLKDIPGPVAKAGTSWKMNFYRFDAPRKDGKPTGQVAWSWTPSHGFFHNIEHFGTVRFMGKNGPVPTKPLEPTPRTVPKKNAPESEGVAPDSPE